MNWKNVLYLLRVERKSGRLLRGIKTTGYHESGILAYWPYWVASLIGIAVGYLANLFAQSVYSGPQASALFPSLADSTLGFYASMPTFILIISIVFTMFQQIQVSGIKKTAQVMYWLPVTWQEHTMASILSNLMGLSLALATGFAAASITFGVLNGLILQSLIATVGMFAAAFMGSTLTEIIRILQVRFTGAVYKSSGRAAIYIRLIGSLVFFITFYIIYFTLVTGNGVINFITALSEFQTTIWYVPFIWVGIALFNLFSGEFLLSAVFAVSTAFFIASLYYLAVLLNKRFGLYEPPAIRVQASGVYTPKTGILGKLGFSSVEAALISKDIKAFTRRRELMGIFILPIVIVVVSIFNSINVTSASGGVEQVGWFFVSMIFLFPAATMAMSVGNMLIGEEGQAVWRIYISPITAKNLVKSKYAFLVFLSLVSLIATGTVGVIFFQPSFKFIIAAFTEGVFLTFALGAIGLAFGFRGADFTVSRRPRMIRQEWALISLIICAVVGLIIIAPLMPFVFALTGLPIFGLPPLGSFELVICLTVSGVIAAIFTAVFYRINLNYAKELLRKAET